MEKNMAMTVDQIMTLRVVTVALDDPLETLQELFQQKEFHHLIVVEKQKVVGVISDRDLLRALSPYLGTKSEELRDLATLKKRAHQIMSRQLITIPSDTCLDTASRLLLEHHISCLPVTDTSGTLVGVVSWRDLLKAYLEPAEVVASPT